MIETVFRTDDVAAADRFDYWRDCMAKLMCPTDMTSAHDSEFKAESRLIQLGAVSVWPGQMQPLRWRRTPRLIRQSDPELYHLSLPFQGAVAIAQDDRTAVHRADQMYFIDTSLPFDCDVPDGPLRGVGLEIPKALVPLPEGDVARLLTRRLSARDGVGSLLAGLLGRLVDDAASFTDADGPRLETVLVDLFTATLAHHLDAQDAVPAESHRRALTLRVQAFIRAQLSDPELTPGMVAAAHHISTSHLHGLFRDQDLTVSGWIRHQRLEHARRDLSDPAQYAVPVHRIAARWGFTHHAVFSRAFCAAYGVPPRDYRQQSLGLGA
ncbi:AraC family transcriptional regulator [Streptomyces sp. AcH 505]|uniref:AraC-like ligand-binding domain-containing protein n=1 Tax=Streptomyces sp. AcH 505 TaxID=352211 RepID=UPI000591FD01|nr:AraC family transcriptional regulator [Streptomyces sp. AcH 505]